MTLLQSLPLLSFALIASHAMAQDFQMDMSHRDAATELSIDTPSSRAINAPFQINLRQICHTDDSFAIPAHVFLPPQGQALPDLFWATRTANNEIILDWTEQSSKELMLEFLLTRPHCDQFPDWVQEDNALMPIITIAGQSTFSALLAQSLQP
jgi:hypothetical protein